MTANMWTRGKERGQNLTKLIMKNLFILKSLVNSKKKLVNCKKNLLIVKNLSIVKYLLIARYLFISSEQGKQCAYEWKEVK